MAINTYVSGSGCGSNRFFHEGLWVATGQVLAALGLLVGVRLQTEYIPPYTFGNVALFLGYAALAVGTFCTPALQAAIRFYPEAENAGQLLQLRKLVGGRVMINALYVSTASLACGSVYCTIFNQTYWEIVFLAGLILLDSVRSLAMIFLNAARRQRPYAIWSILEAWLRPAAAVACALLFGATTHAVLGGYVAASAVILLAFSMILGKDWSQTFTHVQEHMENLSSALRAYSKPLAPLAVLGWISSLSDRYIIAGVLGLTEAGIYAAAYGLVSRPFLVASSALELTARPHYFEAVATVDRMAERRMFRQWMIGTVAAGILLLVVITIGSGPITRYLLGRDYSSGQSLMPLVALGYLFLIITYTFNAYLYAHKDTRLILMLGVLGAILSVCFVLVAAYAWGLTGVAAACAATFGVLMLTTGMVVSLRHKRQNA